MINNTKILWIVVAIVAVISVVAFFNGRTITQVITNPLSSVASPFDMGTEIGQAGLQQIVVGGSFANSTTTILTFEVPLPRGATGTLEFLSLKMNGVATTTFDLYCGPAATSSRSVLKSRFMSIGQVGTSTNFGTVTSGVATSTANGTIFGSSYLGTDAAAGGRINVSGGSNVSCIVEVPSTYTDATFAYNSTSFKGVFKALIRYVQN